MPVWLHLDLGEWMDRDGTWSARYEVVAITDREAVAVEVSRQLSTFRSLAGGGATRIHCHQHIHLREPVRSVELDLAADLAIPVRQLAPGIRYCGDFYGQSARGASLPGIISRPGLIKILEKLPPGLTELSVHPGEGCNLATAYREERGREMEVLCDPRARSAIAAMGTRFARPSDWGGAGQAFRMARALHNDHAVGQLSRDGDRRNPIRHESRIVLSVPDSSKEGGTDL